MGWKTKWEEHLSRLVGVLDEVSMDGAKAASPIWVDE
jgi:hypothetical protein